MTTVNERGCDTQQSQKAVTAYFLSKQLLPIGDALQYYTQKVADYLLLFPGQILLTGR